jgi:hypothetical protein
MKFRILEKVFTSWTGTPKYRRIKDTYFIYKNPTSAELNSKEDSKGNRAILDTNGDLYMEARWLGNEENSDDTSGIIHEDLFLLLQQHGLLKGFIPDKWYDINNSIKYGICLHRDGDTKFFDLAESYNDEAYTDETVARMKKIFKLAKEKNKFLIFPIEGEI